MSFLNQIVAGLKLVRAAIQSPDYDAGVSGWSINRDGSAEFNNVAIRGGGSSDPLVVGPTGLPQVVVRTTPTNGLVLFPTNRPIEAAAATLNSAVVDEGAATERAELQMTGPTVTGATDGVRLVLRSQPNNGSLPAEFSVQSRDGTVTYLVVDETEVRVVERRIDSRQLVATAPILTGYVTVDPFDRIQVLASGEIQLGPGASARDVVLRRGGANLLQTPDNFDAANYPSGAWTSFTPSWTTSTGANLPDFGDATLSCEWTRHGLTITARYEIVFGAGTNFGGGGAGDNWRFGLPVEASATHQVGGFFELNQSTAARCIARARFTTTTALELEISSGRPDAAAIANRGLVDAVSPWAWVSGNALRGIVTYEAAA